MKTYIGKQLLDGTYQVVIEDENGERELPLRLDLENKSPTGFAWGYSGSGLAQLALALLADAISDEEALQIYRELSVSRLDGKPIACFTHLITPACRRFTILFWVLD